MSFKLKLFVAAVVVLVSCFIGFKFYVSTRIAADSDVSEETVEQSRDVVHSKKREQSPQKLGLSPAKSESVQDDSWKRRVSTEVLKRIAEEKAASETPEAKAQARAVEAVREWESVVERTLSAQNKESLNNRGRRLRKSLSQITGASDKNIAIKSLLTQLPDDQFGMLDEMLLFPQTESDRDVAEAIFSDLLNRPDTLKDGYIKKISEMRDHPNHVDALHIRTVEGLRLK